jgi:uncharacterized protein YeaO (DUF488 family)
MIRVKRVYEEPTPEDGFRVLVDRLWPRGLSRERAQLDAWFREVAPSTELRKWYSHDESRWEEFCRRYYEELDSARDSLRTLEEMAREGDVTLIYSAKNTELNNAVALKRLIERMLE